MNLARPKHISELERQPLLSVDELADFLGVKTSWIRAKIFKKEIPYIKLGRLIRFRNSDIESFIKDNLKEQCHGGV